MDLGHELSLELPENLIAGKKALIPLVVVGALFSKLFGKKKTEEAPPSGTSGE